MTAIGTPAIAPGIGVVGRRRTGVLGSQLLDTLCELPLSASSDRCGQVWCGYFDDASGRCGLLEWDVVGRMGVEGLRWFVDHRTTRPLSQDAEVLLARTCAL